MRKMILALACLLLTSAHASAQSRAAESLRGLKGVRLAITFNRGEVMDEAQRAELLKLLISDSKEKFMKAGIPLLEYAQEVEAAGSPVFSILITLEKPGGSASPLASTAKLSQKARLARDPTIVMDLTTWETFGVGGPEATPEMIRGLISTEVERFIEDYAAANPD